MAETFETKATLQDLVSGKLKTMQATAMQSFNQMQNNSKAFSKGIETAAGKIVNLKNVLVGLAAVKTFQGLISRTADLGDKFDKLSFRLGVSTKFLQELDFAANLAGTSVDEMQSGIRRLSKSASDVDRGLKVAKDAFDDLNISVFDTQGNLKDTEVLFGEVVNALGEVESSTKRVALSQEILGRSGTALLPLVAAGADAFEKAKEEANRLGVVMDSVTLKATVDYTDALFRMKAAVKGQLIKTMIPTVRKLADIMQAWIDRGGFDQWSTQIRILTSVGKALLITYSITKFTSVVSAFKITGDAATVAAAKAARAQAVMNGLKFAGFIAVISAIQFAFDSLIKAEEKLADLNTGDVTVFGDTKKLQIVADGLKVILKLREEGIKEFKSNARSSNEATQKQIELQNALNQVNVLQGAGFVKTSTSIEILQKLIKGTIGSIEKLNEASKKIGKNGGPAGLTDEQRTKALADQEAFEKELAQIKEANLKRTFEGRNILIEEQRAIALEKAIQFNQDTLDIDRFFNLQSQDNLLAHEENLKKIKEEADKKSFDAFQKELDDEVDAINKQTKELTIINKKRDDAEKQLEIIKQLRQQKSFEAAFAVGNALVAFGIANAKTLQRIELVQSIIQGIGAVQKAFNTAPPANFGLALLTGIKVAANTAAIASQAFQAGGFPTGNNALIKVNERGQEAVLNAGAVRDIGVGNINAMNSGQGLNKTIVNEITYAPTIEVQGEAPRDIIDTLREDKEEFARFFKEDVIERGFLE